MISIIVPVYNAEKTLDRCINSIQKQSYSDFELILVDDGSKDESGKICNSYADRDSRIVVLHKENGGVSSARNLGLDHSQGEWITFVDSDDWLEESFLQSLMDSSLNVDFVASTFNREKEIPVMSISRDSNKEDIGLLLRSKLSMSPWAKLLRKDIIDEHSLRFDPKLKSGEDTVFVWNYIARCKTVAIVDSGLYMFTGKWGDTNKYRLSIDEMSYLIEQEKDALLVNKTFWHQETLDMNLAWSIQYLDGLYSNYTDIEIYDLYCRLIQPIDKSMYFKHLFISQSLQGILAVKRLYAAGRVDEAKELMKDLSHYFTVPASATKLMASNKMIYILLKNDLLLLAHMMLKSLSTFFSNR